MMSKNVRKFALGALVAGAAGYVAGILTAPKAGKETRKDIKKASSKAVTEGEKTLKKLHSELGELVTKANRQLRNVEGKARTELSSKLKTAAKAKQKVREILTALHEGDADNRELKLALKQSKQARDNLKKYLKK